MFRRLPDYYAPQLHDLTPGQVRVRAPIIGQNIQVGVPEDLVRPLLQPLLITCSRLPKTAQLPARQEVTMARLSGDPFNINYMDTRRLPDSNTLLAREVLSLTVWSEEGEYWHDLEGIVREASWLPFEETLDGIGEHTRKAALRQLPLV